MEKTSKPHICEVLGVEVEEDFYIRGLKGSFKVMEGGTLGYSCEFPTASEWVDIINHPDRIIRKPCFSQEEVAVLHSLYAAGARYLARGKHLRWYSRKPYQRAEDDKWDMRGDWATMSGKLPAAMFQALRPGQSVKLKDILGGVHEAP